MNDVVISVWLKMHASRFICSWVWNMNSVGAITFIENSRYRSFVMGVVCVYNVFGHGLTI